MNCHSGFHVHSEILPIIIQRTESNVNAFKHNFELWGCPKDVQKSFDQFLPLNFKIIFITHYMLINQKVIQLGVLE